MILVIILVHTHTDPTRTTDTSASTNTQCLTDKTITDVTGCYLEEMERLYVRVSSKSTGMLSQWS